MIVSYLKWCKRFREYTVKGICPQIAWHKTNKDFGINQTNHKLHSEYTTEVKS